MNVRGLPLSGRRLYFFVLDLGLRSYTPFGMALSSTWLLSFQPVHDTDRPALLRAVLAHSVAAPALHLAEERRSLDDLVIPQPAAAVGFSRMRDRIDHGEYLDHSHVSMIFELSSGIRGRQCRPMPRT